VAFAVARGGAPGGEASESDQHRKDGTMTSETGVPVDLYVAAYSDPFDASVDWDDIKAMAEQKVITVEALVRVTRDADGKIHENASAHTVGVGSILGGLGGFLIGLVFPPALLVSTAAGAGLGAGAGGLVSHHEKKEIKAEVACDIPPGCSGIVVLFEERWAADVAKALSNADTLSTHEVDRNSVEQAKDKAPKPIMAGVRSSVPGHRPRTIAGRWPEQPEVRP
jgi:uncharacterized membrane protein